MRGGSVRVGGRRPTRRRCRRRGDAVWSGWCRRPPPTCSTSRPSRRSARLPTPRPSSRRAPRRSCWSGSCPGSTGRPHPRDLSEGQRLALVLAVVLTARPEVLLLDEPTRGLDYPGKLALAEVLTGLAAADRAVLVATHDVEFVAQVADQVVVLAAGRGGLGGSDRPGGGRVAGLRPPGPQDPGRRLAHRRPGRGGGPVSAPRAPSPGPSPRPDPPGLRLRPRSTLVLARRLAGRAA